jgi:trehalose 6-phosphate phosphatase
MTATYLFNPEALVALATYVASDTLFAFDLDGTLAPIVADYSAARIAEPVRARLERLVSLGTVSVITGRSRKDARDILGLEPHLIVGNHGAEWPVDSRLRNNEFIACCSDWRCRLHEQLDGIPGVEIEFKGESLSIHYRRAIDPEVTLSLIEAAIGNLRPCPKTIGGKFVINLAPLEAFSKGEALVATMDEFGLKRAIFFGDDITDEEIFQLRHVDLFGVHIGRDDWTSASYYLNSQSEIVDILDYMIGIIGSRPGSASKI